MTSAETDHLVTTKSTQRVQYSTSLKTEQQQSRNVVRTVLIELTDPAERQQQLVSVPG